MRISTKRTPPMCPVSTKTYTKILVNRKVAQLKIDYRVVSKHGLSAISLEVLLRNLVAEAMKDLYHD